MTKLVKQRQKNDCVIAAVATITGRSYAEVRRVCGGPGLGMENHEILWLLRQFGEWRQLSPRRCWTLSEWVEKYPDCIVCVGEIFAGEHALAVVSGIVYDPASNLLETNRDQGVVVAFIQEKPS